MRELADRIRRQGPVPFGEFVDAALYEPGRGFFATGHGPGRAGADFLTSPETGPLFGVCIGRALDGWWHRLGDPDPFVVVEAGAAAGRLAREVLRAAPECAPALRYVLVERSAELRDAQREHLTIEPAGEALGPAAPAPDSEAPVRVERIGPIVTAIDELPAGPFDGVVLANELLDNLPFDLARRRPDGWDEIRVGLADGGRLAPVTVPADDELSAWLAGIDVAPGTRVPVQRAVEGWLERVAGALRRGIVLVADYTIAASELAARGDGWLRTFRGHARGSDPLDAPGSQDITVDVLLESLRRSARRAGLAIEVEQTQTEWLRALGIDALVDEGRRLWEAGAARPDVRAIAGRSRASEAAALTDPAALGAHTVVVLSKPR